MTREGADCRASMRADVPKGRVPEGRFDKIRLFVIRIDAHSHTPLHTHTHTHTHRHTHTHT